MTHRELIHYTIELANRVEILSGRTERLEGMLASLHTVIDRMVQNDRAFHEENRAYRDRELPFLQRIAERLDQVVIMPKEDVP
jgi:hypothetical protein